MYTLDQILHVLFYLERQIKMLMGPSGTAMVTTDKSITEHHTS